MSFIAFHFQGYRCSLVYFLSLLLRHLPYSFAAVRYGSPQMNEEQLGNEGHALSTLVLLQTGKSHDRVNGTQILKPERFGFKS